MTENTTPVSVLIVDDNPAKLTALAAELESMDIEIVTATSGIEALRKLLAQEFAVVLLDVNMPIMDGFETANMIRTRPRSEHLPIIFITAEVFTDDARLKGYNIGAVDYIISPVLPQILRAKVATLVDLHRLRVQGFRYAEALLKKNEEIARQNLQLQEYHDFLTDHNRVLEEKVRERTAALQESEEKFRTAIDAILDAFIIIEGEQNAIIWWNSTAEAMFGYSKQEMLGQTPHGLLPSLFDEAAHYVKTVESAAVNKTLELTALRKNRTEFPIELSLSAMQIDGKRFTIVTVRDITERKLVESKLAEQLHELLRWRDTTLGREMRTLELKREVNELLALTGQPPRYLSVEQSNAESGLNPNHETVTTL